MFSKACEYGIRATIYIMGQSVQNKRVGLKDIAKEIESPEAFTAKILQQLVKSKIIFSVKGPTGGFEIKKDKMEKINMLDMVLSIDGDSLLVGCGLGLKKCSESHPCPMHHKFKIIRDNLKEMLQSTTIFELSNNLSEGLTHLKLIN